MKLILSYDASHITSNYLEQALDKSSKNTSFSISTAQYFSQDRINKIFTAAQKSGSLSADFNGAQLDSNELENAVKSAGSKVRVSVNTAQSTPVNTLLSALESAGNTKVFSAEFNGAQLTEDNLERAISNTGSKSKIKLNTAQALSLNHLKKVLSTAGASKFLSLEFNGAQLDPQEVKEAIKEAGENTSFSINTAQSLSKQALLDLLKTAANIKTLSADFNGAQLTPNLFAEALKAAGSKTALSINTAQSISKSNLLNFASLAGTEKILTMEFNGSQINAADVIEVIKKSGTKTSTSINTAQNLNLDDLIDIIKAAGTSKNLTLAFDGSRLTENNLQRAVSAAGSRTTIIVTNAYRTPINVILDIVKTAD
ncbi:hypothetical protein [Salinicola endophyticus]|uniref:Uncharacterized protein n=1 Tax=Salinicola endophyticus TaxID=1949083 RepID=A0AB74UAS9_9GAMM